MANSRWIVGGLLGGAAGVLIWVLVGYFTEYEVGWIAWGIGFLVGVGMRYAAFLEDREASVVQGITASVIAIGSIFLAKFLIFTVVATSETDAILDAVGAIQVNDQMIISNFADEIAEETKTRGEVVNWPPGMTYEEATVQADYPPEIWSEAEDRWNQLSEAEQDSKKSEFLDSLNTFRDTLTGPEFADFFTPWDLLWFGLAAFTAFKVGTGTYGDE